jgi:hypothetical protein
MAFRTSAATICEVIRRRTPVREGVRWSRSPKDCPAQGVHEDYPGIGTTPVAGAMAIPSNAALTGEDLHNVRSEGGEGLDGAGV